MLAKGDWKEIRELRKGFCPKPGRLKDGQDIVESNLQANVLAKHFGSIQWCNRFTTETSGEMLGPLPVSQDDITVEEVITAAKTLKTGRQRGEITCLQRCVQDSLTCQWAVCLCNKVWCSGHVPDD